jgi:hypothetical protein
MKGNDVQQREKVYHLHTAVLALVPSFNLIMVSLKFLAMSGVAGVALAHPQPTPTVHLEECTDCAKVNGALDILKKLGPSATSFCRSYLKVPMTKALIYKSYHACRVSTLPKFPDVSTYTSVAHPPHPQQPL